MFYARLRLTTGLALFSMIGLGQISLSAVAESQDPKPVETILDNGARVICLQETGTPLVALDVFVQVGAAQETSSEAGIGSFVARTVLASTTNNTPDAMATQIGALGDNVSATWQADWTQISALTVSDQFDNAAYLVTDVLRNANFDSGAVEEARQQILSDLQDTDANLFQTAYTNLRRTFYAGSGYALPALGNANTIHRLRRGDLQAFFNRYYIPKNFVFVVVGNIDSQTAVEKIRNGLAGFPIEGRGSSRPDFAPAPPPLPTQDFAPLRSYQGGLSEVCLLVGYRAPGLSDPDYPAMQVANALLGGMKTSLLFTNLREKQGLAYELGSVYSQQRVASDIAGYVYAPPTRTDPSTKKSVPTIGLLKEQLLSQFQTLRTTLPTAAALARAQHFLIGSYKIKHERLEDRATLLGIAEIAAKDGYLFDTNYTDYINKVTAADVQRVAAKYFVHPGISTVEPTDSQTSVAHD